MLLSLFGYSISAAQVPNDNIEDRIPLLLNQVLSSNTIGATVQWNCLNQDLTRSCIKYHNDQWFEFSVEEDKPYYINISGQDCQDIWGVQVLVFSGVACTPETYELVTCYSEGNRDDIFITLDRLNPGENYLVNIDGYLHDQCAFNIQLSDEPNGLPVVAEARGNVQGRIALRKVDISWTIPDSVENGMKEYEVWKNTGDRSELIEVIGHEMNAFGSGRLEYSVVDTLHKDDARYTVVGVGTTRYLVGDTHVRLDKEGLAKAPENIISMNLAYEKGENISLELWDAENDRLLYTRNITFDPKRHSNVELRVMRFREDGVGFFKVVLKNQDTGKWDLRFFEK
jgi:hypothetical protein